MGLAEIMNYVGTVNGDKEVLKKISYAKKFGKHIDGHAPMLSGKALDKYISLGIKTDHECSSYSEASERIRKGQYVMIRHGTAAKNLHDLLALFDTEQRHRCVFATDDKEPSDLINKGHIDYIIRKAVSKGKSVISAIQMASLNAANCFSLADTGAVAPGYFADILVLDDLEKVSICDVYKRGRIVVKDHKVLPFDEPKIPQDIMEKVKKSINCRDFSPKDFYISSPDTVKKCNVIGAMPFGLITEKKVEEIDFSKNNGIDTRRDILKIAVAERHNNTGNIGLGFICGIGLKEGAIAATVSHDSHNIIVIGTNDCDMAIAANRLKEIGGGNVIVKDGKAVKEMPLPLGGLMSDKKVSDVAKMCEDTRGYVHALGVPENIAPFMNMAFVYLPVIPHIKLTTKGLFDVDAFCPVSLAAE